MATKKIAISSGAHGLEGWNPSQMPARFLDEHIACLKRVMLPRFPECKFTQEDYAEIMKDTGLEYEKIEHWAEHVRLRLPLQEDRQKFLTSGKSEKVT